MPKVPKGRVLLRGLCVSCTHLTILPARRNTGPVPCGHHQALAVEKGSAEPSMATHVSLRPLPASEPPCCDLTLKIDCIPAGISVFQSGLCLDHPPGGSLESPSHPTSPAGGSPGHGERQGRKAGPQETPIGWGSFFWHTSGLAVSVMPLSSCGCTAGPCGGTGHCRELDSSLAGAHRCSRSFSTGHAAGVERDGLGTPAS